ncbi:16S rRNA (uracil(1498)-N(3))-methyltransferase [uncultured Pelagimonas sp.]|uniref:16S rRNA (uracil(1498)-N(3))-methyltransferase n=1 Tax=uncultured Pelagimonas sp. TaxID=1618102 RepID=UPI0026052091|nr:16S rRNA (uracil(1498)-N(3))-methyltransferase [uncultured Pelagimonas sp.]
MKAKIRLYVEHPLGPGQDVSLSRDQAHYLFGVMRLAVGARVALFNGVDGEWQAAVTTAGKRGGVLTCDTLSAPLGLPPDLWLCFAPIKKTRTDFIVEKAVEMGARRILPMGTDFTNSERIRQDRLQAHAVEAAEQCGATYVPEVVPLIRFDALIDQSKDRQLMFCDEAEAGAQRAPDEVSKGPWCILIGPEGGFSDRERSRLQSLPNAHTLSLGPRILRAETAAVAAMTLWQTRYGDW